MFVIDTFTLQLNSTRGLVHECKSFLKLDHGAALAIAAWPFYNTVITAVNDHGIVRSMPLDTI